MSTHHVTRRALLCGVLSVGAARALRSRGFRRHCGRWRRRGSARCVSAIEAVETLAAEELLAARAIGVAA